MEKIPYKEHVKMLGNHAADIFTEMTGTEVLDLKIKEDERLGETIPMAHVISYEHIKEPIAGKFILGFANTDMAVAVASALAEKLGLNPVTEMDEIALDVLNEFVNTIVGRTISEWDRIGMPVRFSPPSAIKFTSVKLEDSFCTHAYVVILSLNFSHIAFRVTFNEDPEAPGEMKRILVTEDSAVIRTIISRTLQNFGYEVTQAENGKRAVELYDEIKPHLVIMDLVMPEMGGLDAMAAIIKKDARARFVVLTSTARKDQILTAKELGVRHYLIKPFQPDVLMKSVQQFFPDNEKK